MDSLKQRRDDLERRVIEAFTSLPAAPAQAGSALDELDELNRQMSADAARIQSVLLCSTPDHAFRSCADCQARIARILAVMHG